MGTGEGAHGFRGALICWGSLVAGRPGIGITRVLKTQSLKPYLRSPGSDSQGWTQGSAYVTSSSRDSEAQKIECHPSRIKLEVPFFLYQPPFIWATEEAGHRWCENRGDGSPSEQVPCQNPLLSKAIQPVFTGLCLICLVFQFGELFLNPETGVPAVAQQKRIWLGAMRLRVQSQASLSGLRIQCCRELWCRLQTWLGSRVAVALV